MKKQFIATIKQNIQIAEGIYDMRISCPDELLSCTPGQFVAVYTGDSSMLLPRPISICEIDLFSKELRLVYRALGQGTKCLANKHADEKIRFLAPLGNGFSIGPDQNQNIAIVGGGIGVPPMLQLAKTIRAINSKAIINMYLGFRESSQIILDKDFAAYADTIKITTDNGSFGEKGNPIQSLEGKAFDVVYGCGPHVMLKNLAKWSAKANIPCFISLEERMACCIGACLACVCKKNNNGLITHEKVCDAGPVFNAKELVLE